MGQQLQTSATTVERPGERSELTKQALARIRVAEPYFAFADIAFADIEGDSAGLTASVPSAPPIAPEVGVIQASQVARHLAILGSCAAALQRDGDQPHHYLAMAARYERSGSYLMTSDAPMRATAQANWLDKRSTTATMTLFSGTGDVLNRLEVDYAVVTPKMFSRFNPPVEIEPDEISTTGETLVELAPGHVLLDSGQIPLSLCEGHFPGHPAAPVALVMGELVKTARHALCSQLGREVNYLVESGTVDATRLAQAGEQLVLEATYQRETDQGHLVHGTARADDEPLGSVAVYLTAV